jgi:hypothetical protein
MINKSPVAELLTSALTTDDLLKYSNSTLQMDAAYAGNFSLYEEELTLTYDEKSQIPNWLKFTFIFIYIVLFVIGLIGNIIVIYFVLVYKRMQTMTNKFITNLSFADLLVIVVCMPVTVTGYFSDDQWLFGRFMCHITSFIQGLHFTSIQIKGAA